MANIPDLDVDRVYKQYLEQMHGLVTSEESFRNMYLTEWVTTASTSSAAPDPYCNLTIDGIIEMVDEVKKLMPKEEENAQEPLNWLPESLYQLYGQLLKEQTETGELSLDVLKKERDTLKKLVRLCQSRLRDIQDTMVSLKELEAE